MTSPVNDMPAQPAADAQVRAAPDRLRAFCRAVLQATGVEESSASACTDSILHGSLHGVDSHGVRLLPHYVTAYLGGRLNRAPRPRFERRAGSAGIVHGDHAQGALPTYLAADTACAIAAETGVGAVGVRDSSHFGPAGAYALRIAERGAVGLVFCNSDAFVRLHDGAARFHGTNPIAMAAPVPDSDPWLFDMATSAVPYNRVRLYASTGQTLPDGVASDGTGRDTRDAGAVEMLAPLGGAFGHKGAGLAGMAEILSAVLTGGGLSPDLLPMGGPDLATPRGLGAFVLALDPAAFAGAEAVARGMARYLDLLRASPARPGARVMAPGDREWAERDRRLRDGIPLDPDTTDAFRHLSDTTGAPLPFDD
ncbi:MAG: Ldh family oxidoreductase [Rhodobacteraceae bacterium]|nr:Ldh family oxidoreductase [Paracoccaceae bacterium]